MISARTPACACIVSILLAACAARQAAPVVERAGPPTKTAPVASAPARATEKGAETYTVKRGDTLYSIALDNGLDYKELADWNSVTDPALIKEGQVLRMRAPESTVQVNPVRIPGAIETRPLVVTPAPDDGMKREPKAGKLPYSEENLAMLQHGDIRSAPKPAETRTDAPKPSVESAAKPESEGEEKVDWGWPASGKIIAGFSESANKGVDIAGKMGDPVFASAGGKVVYSGIGLRGYGKLIIIKHSNSYLSAYAHNRELLVKEGQTVAKGQRIAEIGNTDADQAKLHFEIRRLGKPVDPIKFLPDRPS
jgi:lipoprotein NlpD